MPLSLVTPQCAQCGWHQHFARTYNLTMFSHIPSLLLSILVKGSFLAMSQVFALSFVSLHVFQYIKIVDFKVVYESLIAWDHQSQIVVPPWIVGESPNWDKFLARNV
jgi:hypothetical protein